MSTAEEPKNLKPSKAKKLNKEKTNGTDSKSKSKTKDTKSKSSDKSNSKSGGNSPVKSPKKKDKKSAKFAESEAPTVDTNVPPSEDTNDETATPRTKKKMNDTEKRKKILRYRRVQSRYKLAKIDSNDSADKIQAKMDEIEKKEKEKEKEKKLEKEKKEKEKESEKEKENQKDNDDKNSGVFDDDVIVHDDDDDDEKTVASYTSDEDSGLDRIALTDEQEAVLDTLELTFLESDPDFYGFIPLKKFNTILSKNDLTLKDDNVRSKFEKSLMLIDDGVDYYGFLRSMRENGTIPENEGKSLLEIMEYMGDLHDLEERRKNIDFNRMRTRSLANWVEAKQVQLDENDPLTPLKTLINDMALDDDEIDFASLKTALNSIGCNPKDADLEYLINYLDTTDSGMIDFQYFFQFLHDAAINKRLWKNLTKLIESVAAQMRRAERAEKRRKHQNKKLKERLEMRRRTKQQTNMSNDLEKAAAEERKQRAMALKAKAKQYR